MSLYFENETEVTFDFDCESLAKQVIDKCLDYVNCPFEAKVEVTLTNDEEIHRINKEFRQMDRATDVLSFPMIEYDIPGDFAFLEEDDDITPQYFDCESGELLLGDIVISVDKVRAQAKEYGHSEKREYAFLVAHSMFHLFGYDHMEEVERIEMEKMQREVLALLKIER